MCRFPLSLSLYVCVCIVVWSCTPYVSLSSLRHIIIHICHIIIHICHIIIVFLSISPRASTKLRSCVALPLPPPLSPSLPPHYYYYYCYYYYYY